MMFWFVLLLLGLLAAAFVVAPLILGKDVDESDSRKDLNLALYREHVSDLIVEDSDADALEKEAQRVLLQDTVESESDAEPSGLGNGSKLLVATCLLVPVLGLVVYADFGFGRGAITDLNLKEELATFDGSGPDAHRQLTEKLAARAEQRPEDAELNFFLARSYGVQGEYDKAASVYQRLMEQYPNDAGLHSYYAEALFVADDRKMTERVRTAMDRAMGMNPHDITLLEIEGIAAISEGRPREALEWFQKALATGVTGQRADLIRVAVNRLHNQLGLAGEVKAGSAAEAPAERVLNLMVSASDAVTLPSSSTVFVYARAAAGPPAPLAVQRLTLADLPATIRLDDRMAMMEGMGLSNFDSVTVIARVSSTGGVTPSSGDFEARTEAIDMTSIPDVVNLVIEKALP